MEKVYEDALSIELSKTGLLVEQQIPINVFYEGEIVGEYFADLLVDDKVIVELKSSANLNPQHEAQLIKYLKATNIEIGLLLNFGPEPKFIRKIFTNKRKKLK